MEIELMLEREFEESATRGTYWSSKVGEKRSYIVAFSLAERQDLVKPYADLLVIMDLVFIF